MLRRLFNGLANLVYPARCLSCRSALDSHAAGDLICATCLGNIKRNTPPFCHYCGRQLEKKTLAKNICRGCLKKNLHFDRAFSPCVYEGVAKELIHEFKYRSKEHLGKPLSTIMLDFIREYRLPVEFIDLVIPVPLAKNRLREREFNQSEILARHIAGELKKPLVTECLKRHRSTRRQTDLQPEKRFLNVSGSFSVTNAGEITGKNVLLIDDVLTTGATSSEAAGSLKNAGARIVFVLTLAN